MTRLMTAALATAILFVPTLVTAQTTSPLMDSVKGQFGVVKGVLLKTAEKVPEPIWAFKPTPEVRTFGQIVGHIADANLAICGMAAGEKATPVNAEKTLTTKADLTKALADSIAFATRSSPAWMTRRGWNPSSSLWAACRYAAMVLGFNTAHDYEHYGNLVTYMRINKIVPPSSEGSGMD